MKKRFLSITAAMALVAALSGCRQSGADGKIQDYISAEEAKSAALSASQVDSAGAAFSAAELGEKNGIPYYEVAFTADGLEYRYAIDAQTGTVIESSSSGAVAPSTDDPSDGAVTTQGADQAVDEAQAKQIALAHAGVQESDTAFLWVEADYEDGVQVYDVEFYVASTHSEYDYEIDAATGEIRSFDYDAENYNAGQDTGGTDAKSEDEIRQIALDKVPGATDKDIRLQLDRDDGKLLYEGKIVYQGMEYEFEIDAYSGAILEWEAESIFD